MAESSKQQPAKPGTACLGCRRRKLKCTREPDGCNNCWKSDLPCVYPAPETGVKRKRGPYKKDKPPRERHLEDLVKYLEPKALQNDETLRNGPSDSALASGDYEANGESRSGHLDSGLRYDGSAERGLGNSEDLVKDALIALTKSSVEEPEDRSTNSRTTLQAPNEAVALGLHPPIRRIFEYWHLFVSRVDPLTKVIHCPTFSKKLFVAIEDLRNIERSTDALLFSIYYAAVTTCTPREAQRMFGESREVLLQRYGRTIEASLSDNYSMPAMESVQALVIYVICIRREDNVTSVRALFSLAVRMAQLLGLQDDSKDKYSPFETEMRRRLWWHICSLESRGSEEGASRSTSILEDGRVQMPANVFDFDIYMSATKSPLPRSGMTDMSFVLLRFDNIRSVQRLVNIRKRHQAGTQDDDAIDLKTEQRQALEDEKKRFDSVYLRHMDESRPFDWMCIRFTKTMLIKSKLVIEHPFGQVPTKQMTAQERFSLLQASVDVIGFTHSIGTNKGVDPWMWYFRGWTQWHSLAIIIAELCWSTNTDFVNNAWAVLDPILARWDRLYQMKREEPAWDHVNALIERARQMRQQNQPPRQEATRNAVIRSTYAVESLPPIGAANNKDNASTAPSGFYNGSGGMNGQPQPSQSMEFTAQQFPPQTNLDVPFQADCAPMMPGLEADFASFEGLDSIDFSAFDAVFGDMTWEYSSPNTDLSLDGQTS